MLYLKPVAVKHDDGDKKVTMNINIVWYDVLMRMMSIVEFRGV